MIRNKLVTGVFGSKVASHSSKNLEDWAGTSAGEGRASVVRNKHAVDSIKWKEITIIRNCTNCFSLCAVGLFLYICY